MNWKKTFLTSTEVWTGASLILAGLTALCMGLHGTLALALAPFGVGLILSDVLSKTARATRERSKIRVRRDDDN